MICEETDGHSGEQKITIGRVAVTHCGVENRGSSDEEEGRLECL
jgi:hypothetical protein